MLAPSGLLEGGMSNTPPPPDRRDPAEVRRSKLIGRAVIIGFGLLLLAYIVVTFTGGR